MVAPGATPTGGNVTPRIFESEGNWDNRSLPPAWSASTLVLRMYRTGFGGAGEAMIALSDGLDQRYGLSGQCMPRHLFVAGEAANEGAICNTVWGTLPADCALPVSTSRMPSRPIDATMLPPAPISM